MIHPDIAMMNGRERAREMLAEAERRRLARQAQEVARAARLARRPAPHGSGVPGLRWLSRALLRAAR
jgi:hypothetical protein